MHDVYGGTDALTPFIPQIPLRRLGEPEDVAEAALFLVSEKAAYIHGATLDIGGER